MLLPPFSSIPRKYQFVFIFLFRFINSILIRTYWDPDEYWQCGEVAWWFWNHPNHSSGRTWEWIEGIRSSFFVFPFILLQPSRKYLPNAIFRALPKILMSLNQATIDFLLYDRISPPIHKKMTLLFQLCNPFTFLYGTRTLANNVESLLFIIAYAYPNTMEAIVSLSIWIRPSTMMMWIFPIIASLPSSLPSFLIFGPLAILLGIIADSLFYSSFPMITWWNFFKHNILDAKSHHYGKAPFHYHFLQSLPMILGPFMVCLPFFQFNHHHSIMILSSLILLSIIDHKEHRFTIPLIPFLMLSCAKAYRKGWMKIFLLSFILLSSPLLLYFSLIHGSAPLKVMDFLRKQDWSTGDGVFFAMPCHSTPHYGFLNLENPPIMHFLSCEPVGVDNAKQFYLNPKENLKKISSKYRMIVMFENLSPSLDDKNEYQECFRAYNGLFAIDSRKRGDVIVWCRRW